MIGWWENRNWIMYPLWLGDIMITQERLKETIIYDKETGIWTPIDELSSVNYNSDYIMIRVDRYKYPAHRLAFVYVKGYMPEGKVDHKDRVKHNNKWKNLRETSDLCNIRNRGNQSNNKTGVKGVQWCKTRYRVLIGVDKKQRHLGYTEDFIEAVAMRLCAEQCLDWIGCESDTPAYKLIEDWLSGGSVIEYIRKDKV